MQGITRNTLRAVEDFIRRQSRTCGGQEEHGGYWLVSCIVWKVQRSTLEAEHGEHADKAGERLGRQ